MDATESFTTSMTIHDCASRFRAVIAGGGRMGSKIGALSAKMRGADPVQYYAPEELLEYVPAKDKRPDLILGASVANGVNAHATGSNLMVFAWDRGAHREVTLHANYRLGFGSHARGLLNSLRSEMRA